VLKIKEMGDLKVTKSTKRYVDNSKVTDHYAIIPTYVNAETVRMDENTKNVYNLIVKDFWQFSFPGGIQYGPGGDGGKQRNFCFQCQNP